MSSKIEFHDRERAGGAATTLTTETDDFWSLVSAFEDIPQADWQTGLDHVRDVFSAALLDLGVDRFSYHIIHCPSLSSEYNPSRCIVSTLPSAWMDEYTENYLMTDPVLARALQSPMPLRWDELHGSPELSDSEREFFDLARHHGLGDCTTIPIHADRGVAAMTLVRAGCPDVPTTAADNQLLYLMAYYFHQHVRRPLVETSLGVSARRKSLLSPRETETLEWAARGKSTGEISSILGISSKSVDFHMDGARNKLQVCNRTHAVAKAIMLGLVAPDRTP